MKVKELIEALSGFSGDMDVMLYGADGTDIVRVERDGGAVILVQDDAEEQ